MAYSATTLRRVALLANKAVRDANTMERLMNESGAYTAATEPYVSSLLQKRGLEIERELQGKDSFDGGSYTSADQDKLNTEDDWSEHGSPVASRLKCLHLNGKAD